MVELAGLISFGPRDQLPSSVPILAEKDKSKVDLETSNNLSLA